MAVDGIVVSVMSGGRSGVSILKVSGYLDTTTASELEATLLDLIARGEHKLVLDLSGVSYISSAGWGIFISEIKSLRCHDGDLKLAGMVGDVREVFLLLEFHTILESYESASEAVAAF